MNPLRTGSRRWPGPLAALALCLSPAPAAASPLLELTGDAGGSGGLAARFSDPGAFSTYFNPGLLPRAKPQLVLRTMVLADRIDIQPAPRPDDSSIVAETASGAFHDDANLTPVYPPPVPTQWLEQGCQGSCADAAVSDPATARPRQGVDGSHRTLGYLGVGLVEQVMGEELVLGVALLMPVSSLPQTNGNYNDEREQYFSNSLRPELYGDRLTPISIAVGAGSQVLDSLSVGLSFTINLNSHANSATFVPQSAQYDDLSLRNGVEIDTGFTPHIGVAWQPVEPLLLTATLHTEQAFRVGARFSSLLPDGSEQFATRRFTHHFVPVTAALGASYTVPVGRHALSAVAGIGFEQWSSYRDRHDAIPAAAYAWSDRLRPTLALRHEVGPWRSGIDATYIASPVPAQTGRTNYVDNDRLGLGANLRHAFTLGDTQMGAGLSIQAHRLIRRSQTKRIPAAGDDDPNLVRDEVPDDSVEKLDISQAVQPRDGLQTNNPGYPGFSSQGWILVASLSLEVML